MDNVKTDNYYIRKIIENLEFVTEQMKDIDIDGLNSNANFTGLNAVQNDSDI